MRLITAQAVVLFLAAHVAPATSQGWSPFGSACDTYSVSGFAAMEWPYQPGGYTSTYCNGNWRCGQYMGACAAFNTLHGPSGHGARGPVMQYVSGPDQTPGGLGLSGGRWVILDVSQLFGSHFDWICASEPTTADTNPFTVSWYGGVGQTVTMTPACPPAPPTPPQPPAPPPLLPLPTPPPPPTTWCAHGIVTRASCSRLHRHLPCLCGPPRARVRVTLSQQYVPLGWLYLRISLPGGRLYFQSMQLVLEVPRASLGGRLRQLLQLHRRSSRLDHGLCV